METIALNQPSVRKHKILSRPILGAILLILFGFTANTIISSFFPAALKGVGAILSGFILLGIHRAWFRDEYKGSLSLDFLEDKKLLMYIGIFMAIDAVIIGCDIFRLGFAMPTLKTVLLACTAGVIEEVISRVLPISIMMRKYIHNGNYLITLFLPAAIFGIVHLTNALAGQSLEMTIFQIVSAFFAGIFFAAIYLRTASIVPTMIIHGIHDFLCFLIVNQSTGIMTGSLATIDIIEMLVIVAVQIALTVMMLKGHKEDIMKVWKNRWSVSNN